MRLSIFGALSVCIFCCATSAAFGAGPGEGEVTRNGVYMGEGCYADSVMVRYKLDSLIGEPTVAGTWMYVGDCEPAHDFMVWLRVEGAGAWGWVKLDPAIPSASGEWGFNVTGSPEWDDLLCGYDGTRKQRCLSSDDAKAIWKEGRVTGFDVPFE